MAILTWIWEQVNIFFEWFFKDYLELDRNCKSCKYCVPIETRYLDGKELYDFHCAIEQDLYIRYSCHDAFGNFEWEKSVQDWGKFLASNCEDYQRCQR
jgi:hypothetical protein